MSNLYKESTVAGTSYVRSPSMRVQNEESNQGITFYEERVVVLDDGERITTPYGSLELPFLPENALTEFPVLDPNTGTPTGETRTYSQLAQDLYSLYIFAAQARDTADGYNT